MHTCNTEILVGLISDLPTTKTSKSNLGLLFIQEYFLLEVGVKEDVDATATLVWKMSKFE